jgi:hydroxyacylglutathione hydrolase
MILKYFYDARLAQASYLVGCAKTGEALVIDPMRDIEPYLQSAARNGLRITHVADTHIHADYVSGGRELAAKTGATLYLSGLGGPDWQYAYAGEPGVVTLQDGDSWMVGNVRIEALHTPGHTPEHMAYMLTDTAASQKPMGIFTGDFLFAGDVGRPDLLEEAAGIAGTAIPGARLQFQTVQRFKELPDYLQIWPGHGAGSACGKALGAIPSTTLGYEKLINPAFQFEEEEPFVRWLLQDQPEAPRYFAQMKKVNKQGAAFLADLPKPPRLDRATLEQLLDAEAQVMDLRYTDDYRQANLPGTLSVPTDSTNFSTYVGWFVDYARPLYLILPSMDQADEIVQALQAIGVDEIAGLFGPEVISVDDVALPTITSGEVAAQLLKNGMTILDVRGKTEYQASHIVGACNIPLGFLPRKLDELPHAQMVVIHCASGYRSQIGASLLRAHGFSNVVNLTDDESCWQAQLPVEAAA